MVQVNHPTWPVDALKGLSTHETAEAASVTAHGFTVIKSEGGAL